MRIKLSAELETIASYARDEAMRTGSYGIGPDHLCLAMIRHADNPACRILESLGVSLDELKSHIDSRVMADKTVPYCDMEMVRPTRGTQSVFSMSAFEAIKTGRCEVCSTHLLLAICRTLDTAVVEFLSGIGIGYDQICARMGAEGLLEPPKPEYIPRMEEISGALGEQLSRIFGNIDNQDNFYS